MRQIGPAISPQSARSASASPPSRPGSPIISWLTSPAAIRSASAVGALEDGISTGKHLSENTGENRKRRGA